MPKPKSTTKKPVARKTTVSKTDPAKKTTPKPRPVAAKEKFTDEYLEYLERYEMAGADRPRLTPKEFERLDEEFLELFEMQSDFGLDDEQTIRLEELKYLLLDSE